MWIEQVFVRRINNNQVDTLMTFSIISFPWNQKFKDIQRWRRIIMKVTKTAIKMCDYWRWQDLGISLSRGWLLKLSYKFKKTWFPQRAFCLLFNHAFCMLYQGTTPLNAYTVCIIYFFFFNKKWCVGITAPWTVTLHISIGICRYLNSGIRIRWQLWKKVDFLISNFQQVGTNPTHSCCAHLVWKASLILRTLSWVHIKKKAT